MRQLELPLEAPMPFFQLTEILLMQSFTILIMLGIPVAVYVASVQQQSAK